MSNRTNFLIHMLLIAMFYHHFHDNIVREHRELIREIDYRKNVEIKDRRMD
jgi:hypothetical protein